MHTPIIKYYTIFNGFPELVHGFSTRLGGVSRPPFETLNLGLHTVDDTQAVHENRRLFFNALGVDPQRVVFPQQIHSADIKIVGQPGAVAHCDALITNQPNVFLSIQTADCFPVFLYDPVQKVVAIIHSGWRGTAKNITGQTLRKMHAHFNVQAANILALIGPGVQKQCYQVDRSVVDFFAPEFYETDTPHHFLLDLQGAIYHQLLNEGVPAEQIEMDRDCTHCRSDLYYSYRRDGKKSGRMMGIIGIK